MTKLITKGIRAKVIRNHNLMKTTDDALNLSPVVKFFTPDATAAWVIVSGFEDENDMILWGWCDLGSRFPEYGQVSLKELHALRGGLGLPVE